MGKSFLPETELGPGLDWELDWDLSDFVCSFFIEFFRSEEADRVTVINGTNIDQVRQKLELSSRQSKVKLKLKTVRPRVLDKLSIVCFPLVFIIYNSLYWSIQCI